MLDILWKQWTSLGIYSNSEQEDNFLIDPESLLCATCSFGRFDQRLFDEAIGWLCENGELLNIDRLKNLLRSFNGLETNVLGAVSEYLAQKEQKRKWVRVARFCKKERKVEELQDFFMTKKLLPVPIVRKLDSIFLSWGLRRNKVTLRKRIQKVDFNKPSNFLLKMRSFFGVKARADILTYLLFSEADNSLQISQKINFNQRNVYQVLNDLYRSGLVEKKNIGKRSLYAIDHNTWDVFLTLDRRLSYIVWARVFSVLSYLYKHLMYHPEKFEDAYLASSEFRKISEKFIPEIDASGLKVKSNHLEMQIGESYTPQFFDYVKMVIHQLMGKAE